MHHLMHFRFEIDNHMKGIKQKEALERMNIRKELEERLKRDCGGPTKRSHGKGESGPGKKRRGD